jgi:hypothetical protein
MLTTTNLTDQATSAITEGLTSTATSAGGVLIAVVGIAVSIFAAVYVVQFGMRIFRKLKPA